jgi:hypothetical protein
MMKKISIFAAFLAFCLSGCLKDTPNVDFSTVKPTVEIINSGLGYFASSALIFSTDTLTVPIPVNLASVNTLNKDLTITLAVDNSALTNYNGMGGLQYELMGDSSYSFPTKTVTIPAGKRLDTVWVTFYGHTLDPTKNYMLPISITDGDGIDLTGNFNTMYFHAIGNPIAGSYGELWTRWNATDTTGAPTYDHLDVGPVTFSPESPTEISVVSGGTGDQDFISFTNNGGVLSDFSVSFHDDQIASLGITITSGPVLLLADPISGAYNVYFTYNNSSGLPRCILNEYKK